MLEGIMVVILIARKLEKKTGPKPLREPEILGML